MTIDPSSLTGEIPEDATNYVAGESLPASGEEHEVTNPATGERLATVQYSTGTDVGDAVTAAAEAFPEWRDTPPGERAEYLFALKAELEDRADRLATVLTSEHGKTRNEAAGEIQRGIENVANAAGMPAMLREHSGTVFDVAQDIDESATRQPLGVFAAITPFNFPAMIPLWFLPYAVAAGNTFVLKPSERVPLSSQIIAEAVEAAGFPDGVVNLVNGDGEAASAFIEHDDVAGVSFVGSTDIARHVYESAAAAGKRVQAQGGAKNHVYIADSAALDQAVPNLVGSVYGNAGQRCLANDVVLAAPGVHDEVRDRLVDAVDDLVVGDGHDPETDVGPLITPESVERVCGMISGAEDAGAEVVVDGRDFTHPELDGNFLGPTLLDGVTGDMEIAREEIFGPVLCLSTADGVSAAVERINAGRYGNAASIYTERGGEARTFERDVEAGNVGVNVGVCAPMAQFHFGGRKASFFGDLHAQGEDAVQFYTDKTVTIERWYE